MKYVHAPSGAFKQFVMPGEVVQFSPTVRTTAKRLSQSQAADFGVSRMLMTSPPAFDHRIEKRFEDDPMLVDGRWVQQWTVESIIPTDEQSLAEFIPQLGDARKQQINEIHQRKFYSNVTALFPAGERVIQFRDELDRANVGNYSQAAIALVMVGTPDAPMVWRTEDNEIQHVTAQQMMNIAMELLECKQAITTAAWTHKDAITALVADGNIDALRDYDVTTGWPE